MSDKTCDTCMYWGPNMHGHGTKRRIMGKCEQIVASSILWLADSTGPAAIIDDGGGCLVTNPSFGCNKHEPKR